jgi:hypothetical protein
MKHTPLAEMQPKLRQANDHGMRQESPVFFRMYATAGCIVTSPAAADCFPILMWIQK